MKYKPESYDCSDMAYEDAVEMVKQVRQRLVVVRYLMRSIIFAMETVGSKVIQWDKGKTTKRGKYEKLEQEALLQETYLKRVTWEEEFPCS